MKRKLVVIILIVIFVHTGCTETAIPPNEYPEIIGTFQWSYSIKGSQIISSSLEYYNIIIDDKGYIYTYKNDSSINVFEIIQYHPYAHSNLRITTVCDDYAYEFTMNKYYQLTYGGFPYENKTNYFFKIN